MIAKIRHFLNTEKLYSGFLIAAFLLQSFYFAFTHKETAVSPAMQEIKAAQQKFEEQEDKKEFLSEKITQDPKFAFLFLIAFFFVVLLLSAGFILSLICFFRKMQGKHMINKLYETASIGWSGTEIVKIIILFYFWSLATGLVFGLANEFVWQREFENLFILVHTFIMDTAVLCFVIYFVRFKYNESLKKIGLNASQMFRDIFLGFSAYCIVLPLLVIIISAVGYLVKVIQYEPPPHPLVDIFVVEDQRNQYVIYLSIILACTIGPVIEEIFFRGFCYTTLKKHVGVTASMVLTSAFFAFVHYSPFAFIPIFVLGLVLAYLYEKRGSLIPSITLHIVHNSLFIGYFFLAKRIILDRL